MYKCLWAYHLHKVKGKHWIILRLLVIHIHHKNFYCTHKKWWIAQFSCTVVFEITSHRTTISIVRKSNLVCWVSHNKKFTNKNTLNIRQFIEHIIKCVGKDIEIKRKWRWFFVIILDEHIHEQIHLLQKQSTYAQIKKGEL